MPVPFATVAVQRHRPLAHHVTQGIAVGRERLALPSELLDRGDVVVDRRLHGVALLGGRLELGRGLVRGELGGRELLAGADHPGIGLDEVLLRVLRPRRRTSRRATRPRLRCPRAVASPAA